MADAKKICRRCGRKGASAALYCNGCGAPVVNRCLYDGGLLGDPCTHVNAGDAAFCSKCGSHTAFYKAGLTAAPKQELKVFHADPASELDIFEQHPFFR